jgi:hypothetical protein
MGVSHKTLDCEKIRKNFGNFCHSQIRTGTISQHCTFAKNGITSSESIAVDTLEKATDYDYSFS